MKSTENAGLTRSQPLMRNFNEGSLNNSAQLFGKDHDEVVSA